MAVTATEFDNAFPEFTPYCFAPGAINFWLDYAKAMLNQAVWGAPAATGQPLAPYDYGVLFHAAHNISVAIAASKGGLAPGASSGILNHKQVDKVSAGYDVAAVMEEGAGNWNATSYGTRFARLAKQFGNAPLYVSPGGGGSYSPWGGPGYPFPGWFAW